MTVLGKILVFVNLIFSVLVGGLVVVVFAARANYVKALEVSESNRKLDAAGYVAKSQESKNLKADFDASERKFKQEKDALVKDLAQVSANYTAFQEKVKSEVVTAEQSNAVRDAIKIAETRARQAEGEAQKRLVAEQKKNTDLVLDNTRLTQETLSAQIEYKAALERLSNLEKQYQVLAIESSKRGGTAPSTPSLSAGPVRNPPPGNVEGEVRRTVGGLLELSLGSDSGLKVDQTLEVFRLAPKAQYLGMVRITSVSAKVAVAQPIGKLLAEAQQGDRVASQLK